METKVTNLRSHYLGSHNSLDAQYFIQNFLCSNCYGHLIGHLTDEGTLVLCAKCHLETTGYVTKQYVERRRQKSLADKAEAARVLRNVIKSPNSGKSEKELLRELGY